MIEGAIALVTSIALVPGVVGVLAVPDSAPPASSSKVFSLVLLHGPVGLKGTNAGVSGSGESGLRQQTKAHPSLVPKLAGRMLLNQLALFDNHQLSEFASNHRRSLHQLLLSPPPAAQTQAWWSSLPGQVQTDLHDSAPEIIGNLPGVPSATRHSANQLLLSTTVAALQHQVDSGVYGGEASNIRAQLSMLHEVERAVMTEPGQPPRSIRTLDTSLPGRASIVIGDVLRADSVTYLVPGMLFSVEGQIVDWTNTAVALHEEQSEWIEVLGKNDPQLRGKTVATVAWMGYLTPDLFTVGSETLADEGALYLSAAIDSLCNERLAARPSISVVAHSYGSTAAMKALITGTIEVDSFVAVGSPGSDARTVDDLHVRGRNMFVGEASWDPVVGSAFFGRDPGDPGYGAHRMSVAGGTDPITHVQLVASVGHNGYFTPGSESLRNMALIGIGKGSLVTNGSELDLQRTMADFDTRA